VKGFGLSFDGKSSFGFGIWYFVLTFCGCSLTFFVYFYLLLRFLNIFNFYIEDEASGINIEDSIVLMDDGNKDSKSRPKLTIETKAPTTGNKGLDLEKE
jgi:hypothetical protein